MTDSPISYDWLFRSMLHEVASERYSTLVKHRCSPLAGRRTWLWYHHPDPGAWDIFVLFRRQGIHTGPQIALPDRI